MNKKDYIIKLLDLLKDTWSLATGLKILVEGNALDDKSIDGLIDIIENAIDSTSEEANKEKLNKSKEFLEKLKAMELQQQQKDQKEVQELDQMLKNI